MYFYMISLACLLALLALPLALAAGNTRPQGPISLPADDGVIPSVPPEQVQWWYYTGYLRDPITNNILYGFETCVFLVENGLPFLHHVALTDIAKQSFIFQETAILTKPNVLPDAFNFTSRLGTVTGGNGDDILLVLNPPYSLQVTLATTKPPALHYGGLKHKYAFGGYTYYYSRTKMTGAGNLTVAAPAPATTKSEAGAGADADADAVIPVVADVWFDRQYGNLGRAVTQGWEWFAITLDNNSEIMLFNFLGTNPSANGDRNRSAEPAINQEPNSGSVTDATGATTELAADAFSVTVLSQWVSPHTNCTYPASWLVEMADGSASFTVTPMVADQELRQYSSTIWYSPIYWEGICTVTDSVTGTVVGASYVELNGFCSRLGL